MPDAIRVRFAPSPTGMFHVGGARSALFNWALARQGHGRFVLRIEDTDAERNRVEWVEGIISALAAIGISSDDPAFEGPYFQSHSTWAQREASLRLFADGRTYYCDCTREDLATRTGAQQRGYDGYCRDRGLAYELWRALRFRTPDTGSTIVDDVVRGRTEFPNNAMEDFIIARGDGTPVFVLANAVDDIRERITHVVRGEEHLSNTPKQQLLWQAFGAAPPVWAHLPVIVNEQRQKLSKRWDKVALEDYLAEATCPRRSSTATAQAGVDRRLSIVPVVSGLMTTAEDDPDREHESQAEAPAPAAETPTGLQQAASGIAEAQAWKGQQIVKGWRKLVNALRRREEGGG